MLNNLVLFLGKGCYPFTHLGWFTPGGSGTPTKMLDESLLNLEILSGELNVEGVLITKHKEKEIIDHIHQGNDEFTNGKEECMERRRPTAHQMPQAFGVPKAFKNLGNCH